MTESNRTEIDLARFGKCWFLTGPTASGKTSLGILLARRIDAEIVSLDSMAVYRGMDIGTAKPTAQEQKCVPHHLIDLIAPAAEFSVAEYLSAAAKVVDQIEGRGRIALFVGGTPLYLKALLRGLDSGPAANWEFRRQLLNTAASEGAAALHNRLAVVDPASARKLHPNDLRRIIRALEVFELTGKPLSASQQSFDSPVERSRRVVALDWRRDILHARIDHRVNAMVAAGLVAEVRRLLEKGQLSRTALQAVGYREVSEHLAGERGLEETVDLIKTRTRQFAKRQMTWFRSLPECRFVARNVNDDECQVVEQMIAICS